MYFSLQICSKSSKTGNFNKILSIGAVRWTSTLTFLLAVKVFLSFI